jgi:hypothetical protein
MILRQNSHNVGQHFGNLINFQVKESSDLSKIVPRMNETGSETKFVTFLKQSTSLLMSSCKKSLNSKFSLNVWDLSLSLSNFIHFFWKHWNLVCHLPFRRFQVHCCWLCRWLILKHLQTQDDCKYRKLELSDV